MAVNNLIGFSTGSFGNQPISLLKRATIISQITTDAIELNLGYPERLKEPINDELKQVMGKFSYVSIHAPSNGYYGNESKNEWILKRLELFSQGLAVNTIVFHPDTPLSWNEIDKRFKGIAAIENMDATKTFGARVHDLTKLFTQAPTLGFILDLNHIYTLDPTMKLASHFFESFSKRLKHCHVSGYGKGPHDFISISKETEIIRTLPSPNVPIINEGGDYANIDILKQEYLFLTHLQ